MLINLILAILVMMSGKGEFTLYEDYSARYETSTYQISFDRLFVQEIRTSIQGYGIDGLTHNPEYPMLLSGDYDNIPYFLYDELYNSAIEYRFSQEVKPDRIAD